MSYDELKAQIDMQTEDLLKLKIVDAHLRQAKSAFDTLGMANAYYFLRRLNPKTKLQYADSVISIINNNIYYPESGYILKIIINKFKKPS